MEILHKAKRLDNGEWIEGYYQKRHDIDGSFQHFIFCSKSHTVWEYAKVDPETVCIYTGMKDKNGQKIWENDIFDIFEEMYSITYQNGKIVSESRWVNKYRHNVEFTPGSLMNTQRYLACGNIKCKLIGNSIDNPELMEVE